MVAERLGALPGRDRCWRDFWPRAPLAPLGGTWPLMRLLSAHKVSGTCSATERESGGGRTAARRSAAVLAFAAPPSRAGGPARLDRGSAGGRRQHGPDRQ